MPVLVESNVEVAVIVTGVPSPVGVASIATVILPYGETLTTSPSEEVQTTDFGAKFSVSTVADKSNVAPAPSEAVVGDTVTEVTDGAPPINTAAGANGETANVFQTCRK